MIYIRFAGISMLAFFLMSGNLLAIPGLALPTQSQWVVAILAAMFAMMPILLVRASYEIFWALAATAVFGFFIYTAPAVPISTAYSSIKANKVLIIFAFCVLLPIILIRSERHLRFFFRIYIFISLVVVAAAATQLGSLSQERLILGEDGNPIWLARAAGFVVVYFTLLYINKKVPFWLTAACGGISLLVVFATGSRGPFLALLIALVLSILGRRRGGYLFNGKLLLIGGALGLAALGTALFASEWVDRVWSLEDSGRLGLYQLALEAIFAEPSGIGVGGFSTLGYFDYPHNLMLETVVELGWLAGGVAVIGLVYCWKRLVRIKFISIETQILYALFIYAFVNSMFSGDMASAKELYLTAALGFVLSRRQTALSEMWGPRKTHLNKIA